MRLETRQARLRTGIVAFLITLLAGGPGAVTLASVYRARVEDSARHDAMVIAASVARILAQQFARAAQYGIPLRLMPGVDQYLSDTVAGTPAIARIVLRGPDGRALHVAGDAETGIDTTSVPVVADGVTVATIEVATDPADLSETFAGLDAQAMLAALACAALAAILAGLTVGGAIDRSFARLAAALRRTADGDFESEPTPRRVGATSGALGRALHALARGNRHVRERRAAFDAYAEELLAVDFDGGLRPDVERLRRDVLGTPGTTDTAGDA